MIRIEFLGFRYHGWQKQADQKTVHGMIDKTFDFVFQHSNYRTLGCGRTDAKVSADDYAFELFTYEEQNTTALLKQLNTNLPTDIRVKDIQKVDAAFNIIQDAKRKEYHYSFSFGEKSHPNNAPFIRDCGTYLDIQKMQEAVLLFEGHHNFRRFTSKPSPNTQLERIILSASIEPLTELKARPIPENAYVFKVVSQGFLRYQVRLMMGALIDLGKGNLTLEDLKQTLANFEGSQIKHIAPSSGLVLHSVHF